MARAPEINHRDVTSRMTVRVRASLPHRIGFYIGLRLIIWGAKLAGLRYGGVSIEE